MEPRIEPFSQRELVGYLLAGLAVERGTPGLPGGWITPYGHLRHPAPIRAPCDGPFIVPAFLRHRVVSPRSSVLRHTRARTISLVCTLDIIVNNSDRSKSSGTLFISALFSC